MEAKELMIGDIVRLVYRVGTFVSKVNLENLIDNREGIMEYEPIPLTAEILEKNGFRTNGTSNEYQLDMDAHTIFYNKKHSLLIIELCGRTCFEYCIANVHELQHALRLCGLTDLADNFII